MFNRRSLFLILAIFTTLGLVSLTAFAQESGGASGGGSGGADAGGGGGSTSENPLAGNQEAITAGKELYQVTLGCAGCHGQAGGGGMGPNISDSQWIYGKDDAALYETIHKGRPNGMPAFSDAASQEQIWQVITFVRSLQQQ